MWWRRMTSPRGSRERLGPGEDVLPAPFARCGRPFASQREREIDRAEAVGEVALVQVVRVAQMRLETRRNTTGKDRDAILRAFPVTHHDLARREVHVLHAQPQAFQDSQPSAVEKLPDETVRAIEALEHTRHFVPRQNHRQARRPLRVLDADDPWQTDGEHIAIQEEERATRQVLRCRRNAALDGEIGQELGNLGRAHFGRMTLAVKQDEASNPVQIGLLGANAVVLYTYAVADLIEEGTLRGRVSHDS
jgi:hypothetical protein